MRPLYKTFFVALAGFTAAGAYSQLVANGRYLRHESDALRDWSATVLPPDISTQRSLEFQALTRAKIYEDAITATHLVDGMVVNRTVAGMMRDHCDSLLFSSLRFVSLLKLGMEDHAQEAWNAIEKSQQDGHWYRHPRCPASTSRDMLLGLLIALSQKPDGFESHLDALVRVVERQNGYFSSGPIYVSYLSPGLARFIARLHPASALAAHQLPDIIRKGYSTAELEVMVTGRGFESHLGALTAWLDMEITDHDPAGESPGPLLALVDNAVAPFGPDHLHQQRLDWITNELVETDGNNLFFRYLRLKAAGALTPGVRYHLLTELLGMKQFPKDRLPMNCDRHADYLWQREYRAANVLPIRCSVEYSGTDFLWMTALLLDGASDSREEAMPFRIHQPE